MDDAPDVRHARKEPIGPDEALRMLDDVDELYVAKGQKVARIDLKDARPPDEELLQMIMGRSGTLRAPAMRLGRTFVVGYNADLLEETLG